MKPIHMIGLGLLILFGVAKAQGQEPAKAEPESPTGSTSGLDISFLSAVPHLVKFTGVLKDASGKPIHGTVSVSFALYESQDDAVPLWQETQELQADMQGRYSVLLGATQSGGLPLDAFAGEQARWLGVQATGQAEGPRVLLVSVPYALKAQEAEQLGGKPASEYVLASDLLHTLNRQGQDGTSLNPLFRSATASTASASAGWPSSWVTSPTTDAVIARPRANAVTLTLGPSVASPSADLFDVFKDAALTKKVFSINATGNLTFTGNDLIMGQAGQNQPSYLRLFGSTANSKLAPPYVDLEKTDASVKTFLAASTTRNGTICVSAAAPTGDCPTSGTLVKTTAFVLPGGPSWTSGVGVPTGACTTGSLYSRADGGAGSTLYVCEGRAWKAK